MSYFTAAAKAQILADIGAIDPTPEVNPLQAELDDALAANEGLTAQLTAAQNRETVLLAKIAAAQQALA